MARFLTDCSVCLEYITGPQKLPCDHTFCSNCVNRLRRGDIIKCPTCNKFHEFRLVRHDFKHAQFLEALETERKLSERRRMRKDVVGAECSMCEEGEGVVWCDECRQLMCRTCSKAHEKLLPNHSVLCATNSQDFDSDKMKLLWRNYTTILTNCDKFNTHTSELQAAANEQDNHYEECYRELQMRKEDMLKHVETTFEQKLSELQSCNEALNLKKKAAETESVNGKLQLDVSRLKRLMEEDAERAQDKMEEIKNELEEKTKLFGAFDTIMFTLQFPDLNKLDLIQQETSTQRHRLNLNLTASKNVTTSPP